MNSEFKTTIPRSFASRSELETVMKGLGFSRVQSPGPHEFWQRSGAREVECVIVSAPEIHPSLGEHSNWRDDVASIATQFGRSFTMSPGPVTGESSNDSIGKALADDMGALGDTLRRVIGRWHAKAPKQAAE